MASVSFGTEIASMRGAVTEKNVRRRMRTDGRLFSFIYMTSQNTMYCGGEPEHKRAANKCMREEIRVISHTK